MKPTYQKGIWTIVLYSLCGITFSQNSTWKNLVVPYYSKKFTETESSYWIANSAGLIEINKKTRKQQIYHPDNSEIIGCDVNDVLATKDNQIYIATQSGGIFKYDGGHLIAIPNRETANKIQATNFLTQDHHDNIWFVGDHFNSTSSGNVFIIKNENGLKAIGKYSIPDLKHMKSDYNSDIWISTSKFLYKLDESHIKDTLDFTAIAPSNKERILNFYFDSSNTLYIHSCTVRDDPNQCDVLYKYTNGQIEIFWDSGNLDLGYKLNSIYFKNNTFYILSSSDSDSQIDVIANGIQTTVLRAHIQIPDNQFLLTIIGSDQTNKLCFQTFDKIKNRTGVFLEGLNSSESLIKSELPFYRNGADAIAVSSDNSVWVAIAGECYQFANDQWILRDHHFFNVPSSFSCVEIKTDPDQQKLYFLFKEFPFNKSIIKIIGNNYVKSIESDEPITNLSIGTEDQFLFISNDILHIYNKDQELKWNDFNGNIWETISHAIINSENKIWITSYDIEFSETNFYLFDNGRLLKKGIPKNFDFNQFEFLYADQVGNLIGSSNGRIWKYSIQHNTYQAFTVPSTQYRIQHVIEDRFGYYWLSTDVGLYRWDGEQEFINWNFYDYPLLQAFVKEIVIDNYNNLWINQSNGLTLFNPNGLSNQNNTTRYKIKGHVFYDIDMNGIRDPEAEPLLPFRTLKLHNANKEIFTQSGAYQHYLTILDDKLEIKLNPNEILTSIPENYWLTKSNYNTTSFDFGIWFKTQPEKISLDVYSSRTRCLSEKQFTINVQNNNSTKSIQELVFKPDPDYIFKSSSIPYDRIENKAYIWNNIEIKPFDFNNIKIIAVAPAFNPNKEILTSYVYLTDKLNPEVQCLQTISDSLLCSFDPNDKLQNFYGESRASQSLKSNLIKYTIRFQNTGNDTAYNIYILDTLDSNLDIQSFEVINSSQPCNIELIDKRILKFLFPKIYLPPQKHNDLGSQGFISYKIKPKESISHQTNIENTAHIYFDLNDPIQTNKTSFVAVDYFPKSPTPKFYESIEINPNPGSTSIKVVFEKNALFKIYNSSGQFVLETKESIIDMSPFPEGIYFIKSINGAGQIVTARFIKTE